MQSSTSYISSRQGELPDLPEEHRAEDRSPPLPPDHPARRPPTNSYNGIINGAFESTDTEPIYSYCEAPSYPTPSYQAPVPRDSHAYEGISPHKLTTKAEVSLPGLSASNGMRTEHLLQLPKPVHRSDSNTNEGYIDIMDPVGGYNIDGNMSFSNNSARILQTGNDLKTADLAADTLLIRVTSPVTINTESASVEQTLSRPSADKEILLEGSRPSSRPNDNEQIEQSSSENNDCLDDAILVENCEEVKVTNLEVDCLPLDPPVTEAEANASSDACNTEDQNDYYNLKVTHQLQTNHVDNDIYFTVSEALTEDAPHKVKEINAPPTLRVSECSEPIRLKDSQIYIAQDYTTEQSTDIETGRELSDSQSSSLKLAENSPTMCMAPCDEDTADDDVLYENATPIPRPRTRTQTEQVKTGNGK